jgi:hypothetical protein
VRFENQNIFFCFKKRARLASSETWQKIVSFEKLASESSVRGILQQGCQIFLGPTYQNEENYTKVPQNVSNGHNIFPMAVK